MLEHNDAPADRDTGEVGFQFFRDQPIQGWTSLMVAFAFFSGVQLLSLGVLGEYLWRTLDAARARKGFLVRERTPHPDPLPRGERGVP